MLLYVICFAVGGIFVMLSAIGGIDGLDIEGDLDGLADIDLESLNLDDIDVGTHAGQGPAESDRVFAPSRRGFWLPFMSFRFWTFGSCFFGLTGLLITLLQPGLGTVWTALIALGMGLLCGTGAAVILRSLGGETVTSMNRPEDMAGRIGIVEIPFNANSRGKVRLSLKGSTIAFSALTQEAREFQKGDPVLVVGLENNKLWVVSTDGLTEQPPAPTP